MTPREYWNELIKESPVGTYEREVIEKVYSDGKKDMYDDAVKIVEAAQNYLMPYHGTEERKILEELLLNFKFME